MRTIPTCHPDREHEARGLCAACYAALSRGRPDRVTRRGRDEPLRDWIERNLSAPTERGCREWQRAVHPKGYGLVAVGVKSRVKRVHRVYYELLHGPIPEGLHVCHRCDNRRCCNPDHLFLGTPAENMHDCDNKERRPKGSTHWRARFTEADVRAIRARHAAGADQAVLAAEYGVSQAAISDVCRRRTWRHVA